MTIVPQQWEIDLLHVGGDFCVSLTTYKLLCHWIRNEQSIIIWTSYLSAGVCEDYKSVGCLFSIYLNTSPVINVSIKFFIYVCIRHIHALLAFEILW